jgi:energy-coupling factor transporter ATP-binding protein EcfA2
MPDPSAKLSPQQQQATLKRFFNALKDEPLSPGDRYYVPYLDENPGDDYIAFLSTEIVFSEAAGVNLLTGQRGTGKSTQLRRLRSMLEEEGSVVFLSDMREYMHMTTAVELTDFFLSIMGALAEEVEKLYGENILSEGYWTRMINFLQSEVRVEEITADWSWVKVKASLRDDASFRKRLQEQMRGHVARLIQQSHGFAAEVVQLVRDREKDPDKKVVFLVDSIEQIRGVGAEEAESVYRSVENLFSGHADSLRLPLLHVVYTIPPWLPALTPGLGAVLGTVHALPSIHIYQTRSRQPDPVGLDIMRRIVEARCTEWDQIFTNEQLERIALNTGGDLREFFYLIKQCLTRAGSTRVSWPVANAIIEGAENNIRRGMLPIAAEDAVWLRRIAETKASELESVKSLPSLARFFDTKLVLNYRNGEDWYDVHPLIRDALS